MIKITDYPDVIKRIGIENLNATQKEGHEFLAECSENFTNMKQMQDFMEDADIRETVEMYLAQIEKLDKKAEPKPEAKILLKKGTIVYTVLRNKEVEAEVNTDYREGDKIVDLMFYPDPKIRAVSERFSRSQIGITLEPVSKPKADSKPHAPRVKSHRKGRKPKATQAPDTETPKPTKAPKAPKAPKTPKSPKTPKAPKAPAEPTPDETKKVDKIPFSVAFINRYRLLNGKLLLLENPKGSKGTTIVSMLSSLQNAIKEKVIRKTDEFASEINEIQEELVHLVNTWKGKAHKKIEVTNYAHYLEIVNSYAIRSITALAKKFIKIQGRTGKKAEAEKLHKAIETNIKAGTVLRPDVDAMLVALDKYISGNTDTIEVSEAALNGLAGIAGFTKDQLSFFKNLDIDVNKLNKAKTKYTRTKKHRRNASKKALAGVDPANAPEVEITDEPMPYVEGNKLDPQKLPQIISSKVLRDLEFTKAGYEGKWKKLIGDPVEPFAMMVFANPGKGKSSLVIEYFKYLAEELNKKCLYISKDEGNNSYTIQEKFERFDAWHDNIQISAGHIPDNLEEYDYVAFDLMNDFNLKYDDFKFNYIEKYRTKGVSFVSIFKTTGDGNFRGNSDWENMFDVSININDEGYAQAVKNRFGAFGVIKFLEGNTERIYKFSTLQDAEKHKQRLLTKDKTETTIVSGTDGRMWVVSPAYAEVLREQGFSIMG